MICLSIYTFFRGTIGQVKKPVIIESKSFMTPQEKKMCYSQEGKVCNIQKLGHRGNNNVAIRQCHM